MRARRRRHLDREGGAATTRAIATRWAFENAPIAPGSSGNAPGKTLGKSIGAGAWEQWERFVTVTSGVRIACARRKRKITPITPITPDLNSESLARHSDLRSREQFDTK